MTTAIIVACVTVVPTTLSTYGCVAEDALWTPPRLLFLIVCERNPLDDDFLWGALAAAVEHDAVALGNPTVELV